MTPKVFTTISGRLQKIKTPVILFLMVGVSILILSILFSKEINQVMSNQFLGRFGVLITKISAGLLFIILWFGPKSGLVQEVINEKNGISRFYLIIQSWLAAILLDAWFLIGVMLSLLKLFR